MAGAAEGAVDRGLTRLRVERLDQLARQDRDVLTRHVKQDGQWTRCVQPPGGQVGVVLVPGVRVPQLEAAPAPTTTFTSLA